MDANLLAPTVKLLQPWQKRQKTVTKTQHRMTLIQTITPYRVNRRHGIVDEVILLFLWGYSVTKANITVLLIPAVTSSTDQVQTNKFIWSTEKSI